MIGKPVALMTLGAHGTVTMCHSRTPDLAEQVKRGDIVIAAAGRAHMITADMIKPGAVVIDVGINLSLIHILRIKVLLGHSRLMYLSLLWKN